jgi:hypothetical protein
MSPADALAAAPDLPPMTTEMTDDVISQVQSADVSVGESVKAILPDGGAIFFEKRTDGGFLVGAVTACETQTSPAGTGSGGS